MRPTDDLDSWVATLASVDLPPMRSRAVAGDGFRAGVVTGQLGAVRLAEFVVPAGECFRDDSMLRESDGQFCQLYLHTHGSTRMRQRGRRVEAGAGDLVLVDPGQPLHVVTTAARYLTVMVPRSMLGLDARELAAMAGKRIPGGQGSGALLSALAVTAVRSSSGFGPEEAARSGMALAQLVTGLLSTQLPSPRRSPDEVMRERIRLFIDARLSDPALTPLLVAGVHHISLRRLHQLFSKEPFTVAALIRHRRLEGCRRDLEDDVHRHVSIAALARRWGFGDPAHFSRLFKSTYGLSPLDHRRSSGLPR
ncbi:helix-turn-helix domain-containing protein [Kineosporia sp. J2-2]|uniref:Helix-turn-helix domain-containing protein n=1 Tax=Kineosporia corallincola TaxID=2835133 RepID=A0ABS5TIW5_9ACTN|nr:helix-turn-helix domain-containing protein [Kineosporia corallincola]MBT0770156.1 helix-turn-helix domain-containing protein [Kineosporia corallincola]